MHARGLELAHRPGLRASRSHLRVYFAQVYGLCAADLNPPHHAVIADVRQQELRVRKICRYMGAAQGRQGRLTDRC